ncbi:MAG TPA: hypothetical protein VMH32_09515 [Burkholderiales bacterium]|nr:hypothetical protein [Burkholderiales bacterium]
MRRALWLLLLLPGLVWAETETDVELRRIDAQLARIQQEQQSTFQQFQMIQELRRIELQAANPPVIQNSPVYAAGNAIPNAEDLARERQQRDDRIRLYTDDLEQLFARYQELEQTRASLLDRQAQLLQER